MKPKQSTAARTRTLRRMLPILYAALQDALRKRRMKPVEFKIVTSHTHAKVKITPDVPEVLADREVVDVVKRMQKLMRRTQKAKA